MLATRSLPELSLNVLLLDIVQKCLIYFPCFKTGTQKMSDVTYLLHICSNMYVVHMQQIFQRLNLGIRLLVC